MDKETDLLLAERNDGKRKDVENGNYYVSDGVRNSEPVSARAKGWATFKRVLPCCLNIFTYCLAGPYLLQISYSAPQGDHWYSNFLMPYALICYALGTVLGVGLKFAEGKILSTYFPKACGHRKFSYQDLQEIGAAGYWNQWLIVFCTCLYVELTASTVGRINGLNETFVQQFPGARTFTMSWFTVEPATVFVVLLICVMALPMWHKTRFDLTWFGLSPLFVANNFPWGFPVYRILVGIFSNFAKLVECHKEHTQAKAAAQKHLGS